MYKCEECKEVFEQYTIITEDIGETWAVCPYCHSDIEEVNECECGNFKEKYEMFCSECKLDIQQKFIKFMNTFSEEERKYLNELYDGKEF